MPTKDYEEGYGDAELNMEDRLRRVQNQINFYRAHARYGFKLVPHEILDAIQQELET